MDKLIGFTIFAALIAGVAVYIKRQKDKPRVIPVVVPDPPETFKGKPKNEGNA